MAQVLPSLSVGRSPQILHVMNFTKLSSIFGLEAFDLRFPN